MSEVADSTQRQRLLGLLFGTDVPSVLEGQMLRTSDVALLFEVSERTVSEWAKTGRIPSVRTPGGHRRYPADGIRSLLEGSRRGTSWNGMPNGYPTGRRRLASDEQLAEAAG